MNRSHLLSGNHPVHPAILSKKELMASIPQLDRLVALAGSLGALVDAADGAGDAFRTRVKYPRVFGEFVERHAFVAFDVGGIRIYSNIQGKEDGLEEILARPLDLPQRTARTAKGGLCPGLCMPAQPHPLAAFCVFFRSLRRSTPLWENRTRRSIERGYRGFVPMPKPLAAGHRAETFGRSTP
jgi:hypothetical protein